MTKFKFKNPFEVTEKDTAGSAVGKGIASGFIKGIASSGLGVGTLLVICYMFHKRELEKRDNEEQDEKVVDIAKAK